MADKKLLPTFLKEKSNMGEELKTLCSMKGLLNAKGESQLQQDIKALEYGINGEESTAYELKNSYMPIYILHDVHLLCDGQTSQIDFLVFTNKICFVIECKSYYGDIEINAEGNFQRVIKSQSNVQKEGVYSPYTQVQRHLDMVKTLDRGRKKSSWRGITGNDSVNSCYTSVVVFTNPKTIIDTSQTDLEVKDKVIRSDELIKFIKKMNNKSNILPRSDEETRE